MLTSPALVDEVQVHDPLSLTKAVKVCRELHIDGKVPSVACLSRWGGEGRLSASGQRVRLRTWRVGGRLVTSRAAVREFLEQINDDQAPEMIRRVYDHADEELAALGV